MRSFLRDLLSSPQRLYRVILIDEEDLGPPRQYQLQPQRLIAYWAASLVVAALFAVGVVAVTPLKTIVPGYGSEEIRQQARLNALRLESLQDSLRVQQQYQMHLQRLITGEVDSSLLVATPAEPQQEDVAQYEAPGVLMNVRSDDWQDHEQPALSMDRMPLGSRTEPASQAPQRQLSSVQFPVLPPVDGFVTRGFDARSGHYAIDIAVQQGTAVRSIGGGYVILADWTQDGGYTIAVQHADGFVSAYKHNERLLKRVGDRVREREAIALSGNSGEQTSGPHVHVELWRNGLAQDPGQYFIMP